MSTVSRFIYISFSLFLFMGMHSCGNAEKEDENAFDYCSIIRKIAVVPEDDGSAEARLAIENTEEKIWLLNICFPEEDTVSNRASIDISVEEDYPVIVEFDTVQSFPNPRAARAYAAEHHIIDIQF